MDILLIGRKKVSTWVNLVIYAVLEGLHFFSFSAISTISFQKLGITKTIILQYFFNSENKKWQKLHKRHFFILGKKYLLKLACITGCTSSL